MPENHKVRARFHDRRIFGKMAQNGFVNHFIR
jgi:hypothetical protein